MGKPIKGRFNQGVRQVSQHGYPPWDKISLEDFVKPYRGPREDLIDALRRLLVHEVLTKHGGNMKRAGEDLGVSDRQVAYWRRKYRY